jgi:hypothetical protein
MWRQCHIEFKDNCFDGPSVLNLGVSLSSRPETGYFMSKMTVLLKLDTSFFRHEATIPSPPVVFFFEQIFEE